MSTQPEFITVTAGTGRTLSINLASIAYAHHLGGDADDERIRLHWPDGGQEVLSGPEAAKIRSALEARCLRPPAAPSVGFPAAAPKSEADEPAPPKAKPVAEKPEERSRRLRRELGFETYFIGNDRGFLFFADGGVPADLVAAVKRVGDRATVQLKGAQGTLSFTCRGETP